MHAMTYKIESGAHRFTALPLLQVRDICSGLAMQEGEAIIPTDPESAPVAAVNKRNPRLQCLCRLIIIAKCHGYISLRVKPMLHA